jgi:hypothetical protein
MAYDITFFATNRADWIESLELINDNTGEPLADAATATEYKLEVTDCGSAVLSASLVAGTITKPDLYTIKWEFSVAQLGALCPGNTYGVSLTMTIDSAKTEQLVSGSLVFKDGSRP